MPHQRPLWRLQFLPTTKVRRSISSSSSSSHHMLLSRSTILLAFLFSVLSAIVYIVLPHWLHSPPGLSFRTYINSEIFKGLYRYAYHNGKVNIFRRYLRHARLPYGASTSEELLALRDHTSVAKVQMINMTYGSRSDGDPIPWDLLYREDEMERAEVAPVAEAVTVPIRLFTPKSSAFKCDGRGDQLPVIVYYHGGGWSFNDLDIYDTLIRKLAESGPHVVVAVEYRKAPEHPFPAPFNDCLATLFWTWKHVKEHYPCADVNKLVIAGDSAGGNIAAGVTLYLRERADNAMGPNAKLPEIRFQVLFYPTVSYMPHNPIQFESQVRFAKSSFFVDAENAQMMWKNYVGPKRYEHAHENQYISPLSGASSLSSLPDALVLTAEYDVLRDEGRMYAMKLREANVPVTHRTWPGKTHGFMSSGVQDAMDFVSHTIANHFANNIYVSE